jgi:hypothetical protein
MILTETQEETKQLQHNRSMKRLAILKKARSKKPILTELR